MTFSAFDICLVLFFALGLRIGWMGQLLALLVMSVAVSLCAFFFVRWSGQHAVLHLIVVAGSFDVAIQLGFIVGLFTATHPAAIPLSRARRAAAKAHQIKLTTRRHEEPGRESNERA